MTDASSPRVLIAEPNDFTPAAVELLRTKAVVDVRKLQAADLGEALEKYDAVWIRLGHRVDARVLRHARRCRVIACAVTGLDHIDLDACAERGIQVLSLRGEREFLREVRATAEHTVGLTLALIRRTVTAATSVNAGEWDRDKFRGTELYCKTAGIVGVGRLGSIVGGYFAALGMDVLGIDDGPFEDPTITAAASLDDLLARADVVSLHVPLAPETEHLISAQELATMKPTAVLINTSRGGVVDDVALVQALRNESIAGAALDVVASEPDVGVNHPLVRYAREHDNLILTPHIGGNTHESFEKTEMFVARKVLRALEGEP